MLELTTDNSTSEIVMGKDTKNSLRFFAPDITIEMTEGKFIYNGEVIEDVHNVYERFNDWLNKVENPSPNTK
jgi:uncharacterized protein YlzI (FlbEa/FlbD family)